MVDRTAALMVIRIGELSLPFPSCSTQEGPIPYLCYTRELTLMAKVRMSQPNGYESRKDDPGLTCCSTWESGLVPQLGCTAEMALEAWMQVSKA